MAVCAFGDTYVGDVVLYLEVPRPSGPGAGSDAHHFVNGDAYHNCVALNRTAFHEAVYDPAALYKAVVYDAVLYIRVYRPALDPRSHDRRVYNVGSGIGRREFVKERIGADFGRQIYLAPCVTVVQHSLWAERVNAESAIGVVTPAVSATARSASAHARPSEHCPTC